MAKTSLFDEFEAISPKAWKQKIQFDLQGADYNETLLWESPEGIKVKPFYTSEDIESRIELSLDSQKKWKVAQNIYAGNATMANEKALDTIYRGAESILFTVPTEAVKLDKLIEGINTEQVCIHFNIQFLSEAGVPPFLLKLKSDVYFHIDIIDHLSRTGNWYFNFEKDHEILKTLWNNRQTSTLSVDTSLYQNAGANMAQQLAYGLAHANEYLHFLEQHNFLKLYTGITFKVAVGGNYFFEIAKIRAIRLLWKLLALDYALDPICQIIASPSQRNKTMYDYNTNMIRTTTESMSAILGGADTVANLAYDAIYHKDNEFGERIARNQLLLLKHESYFDKVSNPSDGAYYIENLTLQLAEKALQLFKSIEKGGGFLKQLKEHTIQNKIKESAEKEQARFDTQKDILVGTNAYQNKKDSMKDTVELYPFVKTNIRKTLIEPIIEKRLAEAIEQKRLGDE